jgi:hypothetical protein
LLHIGAGAFGRDDDPSFGSMSRPAREHPRAGCFFVARWRVVMMIVLLLFF